MSMPASSEQPDPSFERLPSVEDMARQRFGDTEGLAIVRQTTLELAAHYAQRFDLNPQDPEVNILAAALAFSRHKEFTLMVELERDLHSRVAQSPDQSYGEVLFNVTRTGAYKEVQREIDRLHTKCGQYLKELSALSLEQDDSQEDL